MSKRIAAFIIASTLIFPTTYFAWGTSGHRIVAKIAARNLSPNVRAKVVAILGTTDAGLEEAMATAATWPDDGLNKKKTKTGDWHFVDVSVSMPFSVGTLCDHHDCVLDRIAEMSRRLGMNELGFHLAARPNIPRTMTSQEFAFLTHFVGDIHQPLHAANNGDRGGNCEPLTNFILHQPFDTKELHAAWDDDEVRAVMKVLGDENQTTTALFSRFQNGEQVDQLTPLDWARESNDLAKKDIYTKFNLPNHTAPPGTCDPMIKTLNEKVNVNQEYLDGNVADTETQLLRAGIRLSRVINEICAGNGCVAKPRPHS
jgi:hypothetical protein